MSTTTTTASDWLAIFFLALIVALNFSSAHWVTTGNDELSQLGQVFHIEQGWKMFAPEPISKTGWYVMPAQLVDGHEIDLFRNGAPVSFVQPSGSEIAAQLPNERWRTYLVKFAWSSNMDQRHEFARFLCQRWNEDRDLFDPMRVKSLEIDHFERKINGIGQPQENYEKIQLIKYECGY